MRQRKLPFLAFRSVTMQQSMILLNPFVRFAQEYRQAAL
jgi:hypothetical protein